MTKAGDTGIFEPLNTASPGDTGIFEPLPTNPTQDAALPEEAASPEDIRALEEYLTPPQRVESKKSKGLAGEMIRLAFGVVLCAGGSVWEFKAGHVGMGIFWAIIALFAAAMVYIGLTPSKSATPSVTTPVDRLRASGELDVAARDFPHEVQQVGDGLRLGTHYLFVRSSGTVHSYAEITNLRIVQNTVGKATFPALEARFINGNTENLYLSLGNPEDSARVASICQTIQSGNPFVRIG